MWRPVSAEGARRDLWRRWTPRAPLSCPSCGESGRSAFEERGTDEATAAPILRCTTCLSGMVVKSRRGLPLRTPELIDPDTWGRMEMASSQEEPRSASTAPNPIEDPEQLVIALRDQGFSGETLTHLVAETLNKAPVEVALLIAETSAAAPLRRA